MGETLLNESRPAAASPVGPKVSHPIWSRFLARFMVDIEGKGNADYRRENLAGRGFA